jgi:hypothetical protein
MNEETKPQICKKDIVTSIESIINQIESMPQSAMQISINHYDYYSLLVLLRSVLELSCKDEI